MRKPIKQIMSRSIKKEDDLPVTYRDIIKPTKTVMCEELQDEIPAWFEEHPDAKAKLIADVEQKRKSVNELMSGRKWTKPVGYYSAEDQVIMGNDWGYWLNHCYEFGMVRTGNASMIENGAIGMFDRIISVLDSLLQKEEKRYFDCLRTIRDVLPCVKLFMNASKHIIKRPEQVTELTMHYMKSETTTDWIKRIRDDFCSFNAWMITTGGTAEQTQKHVQSFVRRRVEKVHYNSGGWWAIYATGASSFLALWDKHWSKELSTLAQQRLRNGIVVDDGGFSNRIQFQNIA